MVVWHWYWINGHMTSSDHVAKAYTAWSRLLGKGDDSAAVVLYATDDQPGGAPAALESFAKAMAKQLDSTLTRTRDKR